MCKIGIPEKQLGGISFGKIKCFAIFHSNKKVLGWLLHAHAEKITGDLVIKIKTEVDLVAIFQRKTPDTSANNVPETPAYFSLP